MRIESMRKIVNFEMKNRFVSNPLLAKIKNANATANRCVFYPIAIVYCRFLRNDLYTRLVELELEGHPIVVEDIARLENGESPVRRQKDKRKSTFQVNMAF